MAACGGGPSGEFLLIVATIVSIQLAQGRSEEEIGLLAAFFTVLGDNLALLAVTRAEPEACGDGKTGGGGKDDSSGNRKAPVKSIDNLNGSV